MSNEDSKMNILKFSFYKNVMDYIIQSHGQELKAVRGDDQKYWVVSPEYYEELINRGYPDALTYHSHVNREPLNNTETEILLEHYIKTETIERREYGKNETWVGLSIDYNIFLGNSRSEVLELLKVKPLPSQW